MLENHNYSQVIGRSSARFLNELARRGAMFAHSRAITHPSQPNWAMTHHSRLLTPGRQAAPGTSRWLKAPFLRHGALALLARGGDTPPGQAPR
jgi:hypothetical protein